MNYVKLGEPVVTGHVVILVDRTKSSWKCCSKPFLEKLINNLREQSGYEHIDIYYFERDQVMHAWSLTLDSLRRLETSNLLQGLGEPEGIGSLPICAFKNLLDSIRIRQRQVIVVISDFSSTLRNDFECVNPLVNKLKEICSNDKILAIVSIFLEPRNVPKPLSKLIHGLGGSITSSGYLQPAHLQGCIYFNIIEKVNNTILLRDRIEREAAYIVKQIKNFSNQFIEKC